MQRVHRRNNIISTLRVLSSPVCSSEFDPVTAAGLCTRRTMAVFLSGASVFSVTTTTTTKLKLVLTLSGHSTSQSNLIPTDGLFNRFSKRPQKTSIICLSVKGQKKIQTSGKVDVKYKKSKGGGNLLLSEGRDEDEEYGLICPGCGVYMQDENPNLPGYYQKRKVEVSDFSEGDEDDDAENLVVDEFEDEIEDFVDDDDTDVDESNVVKVKLEKDGVDWGSEEWDDEFDVEEDDEELLNSFAPAGVGFGNITEEFLEKTKAKKTLTKAERKRLAREAKKEKEELTVCARCHSLRNYGQIKNTTAENLIPDFDFDSLISTRLLKSSGNADATVVVMVVDCVDFDGSFPKRAARSLFKALEGCKNDAKLSKRLPKLVLVATKVDLLPSEISPTRLDRWVRHRAKAAGAPKLNAVYLVSSRKDLGVRNLLSYIKELAGPRGKVWVIGAQNAGKSTLINTLAKKVGAKATKLTEAAVPGTTLGILRIAGILSAKAKMFDTPGLLHPYLMSMKLNREEQKMIEIRKELRPRTYRIKVGQTVHVGGLMRLDLIEASVQTIYVTVCASPNISLHLGKVENADETFSKHVGVRLQPPVGGDRIPELGNWNVTDFKVSGTSWDVNSADIAVAGIGWFSLGLKGDANLKLWTYDGVQVNLREPLVLDRARILERPGFWLPQAISDAIGNQSKLEAEKSKQRQEEDDTNILVDAAL